MAQAFTPKARHLEGARGTNHGIRGRKQGEPPRNAWAASTPSCMVLRARLRGRAPRAHALNHVREENAQPEELKSWTRRDLMRTLFLTAALSLLCIEAQAQPVVDVEAPPP